MLAAGAVDVPVFPRSSNKPIQAAAMVRLGLGLEGKLLALAAASHSGEDYHVTGAREILAGAGLTEDALQCPPDLPLDEDARRARSCGLTVSPTWVQHELQRQARGDARYLRGQRLADADLHRSRASASGSAGERAG